MTSSSSAPQSLSPRRDAWVGLAIIAPIVAAALFSLTALLREGDDVPADGEYKAAVPALQAQWNEGADVLTILPPWSLRPMVHLRGFTRINADNISRAPLHRARRLIALVEPDAEPWVQALTERFSAPAILWSEGRLRLLAFNVTGPEVATDLRAALPSATVSLKTRKADVACNPGRTGMFKCAGRKSWQHVGRRASLVTENGSDVILAHPPPKGEKLRMVWPNVDLGDALVLRAGFTRDGSYKAKAPVSLRVVAVSDDGKEVEVGKTKREVKFDFATDRFPIPKALVGKTRGLAVEISSPNNSSSAFAIDAYTISGPAGPADAPSGAL